MNVLIFIQHSSSLDMLKRKKSKREHHAKSIHGLQQQPVRISLKTWSTVKMKAKSSMLEVTTNIVMSMTKTMVTVKSKHDLMHKMSLLLMPTENYHHYLLSLMIMMKMTTRMPRKHPRKDRVNQTSNHQARACKRQMYSEPSAVALFKLNQYCN